MPAVQLDPCGPDRITRFEYPAFFQYTVRIDQQTVEEFLGTGSFAEIYCETVPFFFPEPAVIVKTLLALLPQDSFRVPEGLLFQLRNKPAAFLVQANAINSQKPKPLASADKSPEVAQKQSEIVGFFRR
jgi:hypothetical protein